MTRLLEATINGGRHRDEHPAIPIRPKELARDAARCVRAGAGAIHFHVRSESGRESLNGRELGGALVEIRAAVPDIPVGVSTGAWILDEPEARYSAVAAWDVLPDFASVNLHEEGAEELMRLLLDRGVAVEAGVSDPAAAEVLIRSGFTPRCLRILVEPRQQSYEAARNMAAGIIQLLSGLPVAPPILLHGFEETAWPLLNDAVLWGHQARIGFEDTLRLPSGETAQSNADLISEARRRIERLGGNSV
jgi:uncharacterized protein (DUF849 family)